MLELIGGPKSAALIGVTAVLAQAGGDCFDCLFGGSSTPPPPISGPPVTITGPDSVTAGEPARFSVEAQGLGAGAPCPVGVNWSFSEKDGADPVFNVAVPNPPTRTLADGKCEITLVQTPHTWPKARPGTSREALVRVRINGVVINGDGSKKITVVTPAQTGAPAADTRPKPEDYKLLGSSLQLTPTEDQAESHREDSVYWNTALPTGGAVVAPADGMVAEVKVKGKVIPAANGSAPLNQVSVQVLRPDGGVMTVPNPGGSSAAFVLPVGGDADQITRFEPANLCVKQGDAIGLNTRGGWDGTPFGSDGYGDGVPFQIFATSPGASNKQFHKHEGTGNGARFENGTDDQQPAQPAPGPITRENQELLMQVTLATGNARSYECGGPNTYRNP